MNKNTYYLRADRTITSDASDKMRIDGTIKTIYVEAETEEEMYQEALNEFKSNAYNHSVTAKFFAGSELFDMSDLYVGRKCLLLTEKAGIRESIITAVARKDSSDYFEVTFGKLPVTLTKKIRKERQT